MKMEVPKNYDELLKREVDRIIARYSDRLEKALSIYDETQKILEEEEADPELKELLPLKVMEAVRTKGKRKIFKELEIDEDSMKKYADEAKTSQAHIQEVWEEEKDKNK